MIDSSYYVKNIIYDEDNRLKKPNTMNNLYYEIQSLVYLYQCNPDWDETFKNDIKEYVQECTNLLEKM